MVAWFKQATFTDVQDLSIELCTVGAAQVLNIVTILTGTDLDMPSCHDYRGFRMVMTLCPIYTRYERLVGGGTKPALAKLSLARMIAATVLRMWKNEEAYDPERSRPSTSTREG